MLGIDIKKLAADITEAVLDKTGMDELISLLESIDKRLENIEKELKHGRTYSHKDR